MLASVLVSVPALRIAPSVTFPTLTGRLCSCRTVPRPSNQSPPPPEAKQPGHCPRRATRRRDPRPITSEPDHLSAGSKQLPVLETEPQIFRSRQPGSLRSPHGQRPTTLGPESETRREMGATAPFGGQTPNECTIEDRLSSARDGHPMSWPPGSVGLWHDR